MQELTEQTPLPTLLMRTVLQSLAMWPKVIGLVLNILQRLVHKQVYIKFKQQNLSNVSFCCLKVWKQKKVWEGFVKCCERTKPHCFNTLLQLAPTQLKSAFEISPNLRQPLLKHVQSFTPHQVRATPQNCLQDTVLLLYMYFLWIWCSSKPTYPKLWWWFSRRIRSRNNRRNRTEWHRFEHRPVYSLTCHRSILACFAVISGKARWGSIEDHHQTRKSWQAERATEHSCRWGACQFFNRQYFVATVCVLFWGGSRSKSRRVFARFGKNSDWWRHRLTREPSQQHVWFKTVFELIAMFVCFYFKQSLHFVLFLCQCKIQCL